VGSSELSGRASSLSVVLAVQASGGSPGSRLHDALYGAARDLAASPAISRAVISVADVDPGAARWVRPGEAELASAYAAVIELTVRRAALAETVAAALAAFRRYGDAVHAWLVTRLPARTEPNPPTAGAASPGIKYIVLCTFHDDLPARSARRSWDHHVPLALRVHRGAARYVRSWIEAPLTPETPPFQGITELYFPTREDMEQRWFGSEAERAEIVQDIGHFLQAGVRLYTTEHIIKDAG
jgi:hypothetical protein